MTLRDLLNDSNPDIRAKYSQSHPVPSVKYLLLYPWLTCCQTRPGFEEMIKISFSRGEIYHNDWPVMPIMSRRIYEIKLIPINKVSNGTECDPKIVH